MPMTHRWLVAAGLVLACGVASCDASVDDRIRSVETGLCERLDDSTWNRHDLVDRMAHHGVPGVGIAVVDGFEVQWARGYGVLRAGGARTVDTDTLFQTGSIGKSVVAAAALRLVDRGELSLDQDVDDLLRSWRIPDNAFTAGAPVTLRRLLSHTAGITVRGFVGYPRGERLPTLGQILAGAPPANSPPIRVDLEPGSAQRYSGGGYLVVQQLLEDVTGQPLAGLLESSIFAPAGMVHSVADPLPDELAASVALGHRADGRLVDGGWHTYPELGAGPFWTTPTDMARFARELMLAYAGRSSALLAEGTAREMFSPVLDDYGLGLGVGDDGGDRVYGMHDGANEGYRSLLILYPQRGQAAVILTNGDDGDALAREILNSVSREYGWVSGIVLDPDEIVVIELVLAAAAALGVALWLRARRRTGSPGGRSAVQRR